MKRWHIYQLLPDEDLQRLDYTGCSLVGSEDEKPYDIACRLKEVGLDTGEIYDSFSTEVDGVKAHLFLVSTGDIYGAGFYDFRDNKSYKWKSTLENIRDLRKKPDYWSRLNERF